MRKRKFEEIETKIRSAIKLCDLNILKNIKQKLIFALEELDKAKIRNSNKKTQEVNQINFPFPKESIFAINKEINKELNKNLNKNFNKNIELFKD